jgi:hypothetical protein
VRISLYGVTLFPVILYVASNNALLARDNRFEHDHLSDKWDPVQKAVKKADPTMRVNPEDPFKSRRVTIKKYKRKHMRTGSVRLRILSPQ